MSTRWKINSIRFGPGVLAVIGLLTLVVPSVLMLAYRVLGTAGYRLELLRVASAVSLAAGLGLLVVFVLLLAVEFVQDRWLDRRYRQARNQKVRISETYYECQYCGCQKVLEADHRCPNCGKDLH